MVMVDAMACGTPVVALRAGAVPEVVVDGVTGLVRDVPPRWGELTLTDLRLGDETAHISATGEKVAVSGLSADWTT